MQETDLKREINPYASTIIPMKGQPIKTRKRPPKNAAEPCNEIRRFELTTATLRNLLFVRPAITI